MDWTAEDEAEYQRLQKEVEADEHTRKGDEAVDKVVSAHPATRPFSLQRVTVGGIRDAAQNAIDFIEDVGPTLALGAILGPTNNLTRPVGGAVSKKLFTPEVRKVNTLPGLEGEENAGLAERIARGIVSFAVPFTGYAKTVGIAKGATWLGRAGRAMLAGAATDAGMDPVATNLAGMLRDTFGLESPMLDALASEPDEDRVEARFKAAAVNAPFSIAADAVFEGGLRALRAYRAWKGTAEEAAAAIKEAQTDRPVRVPATEEAISSEDAAGAARRGAEGPADEVAGEAFDPFKHTKPGEEIHMETAEDILDFLKRKSGLGNMDQALLGRFAKNLLDGDPADALAKFGIDPLKVDFSALDDAEMLARFHTGLREVYEGIAQRLGRTGVRVTEEATAGAARAMATTPDVLKDLYGHTSNLAEVMYASQTLVGAHAQKLLALAQDALKGGDEAWAKFLETLERHAYFLGALRGAGSEVGRALRSLQMIQKVGKKTAKATMDKALEASEKSAQGGADHARDLAAFATDQVGQLATQAERSRFLTQLIETGADIEQLSRFTRVKAGSKLTPLQSAIARLDGALLETVGNLFSNATGILNVTSGMTMMGLRGVAKALAGVSQMALSKVGMASSMEARVAAMDAWAYTDGFMSSWVDGLHNAFTVLRREGMTEIAIAADAVGAKGLAATAQGIANDATRLLKENFERVDMNARPRNFAMTASDLRRMHAAIDEWDAPKLFQHSLKWLTQGLALGVNTAGSLSRLGTILFINAADEFMGTIAARAGAQSRAVRLAAQEAAELGLEGKALSQFLKARTVQLIEHVDGYAKEFPKGSFEAGQQEASLAHGAAEAREILFQDKMETGGVRKISQTLGNIRFSHLLIPFRHTPLRILERTVIDHTPLGLFKDRLRADILAGGARRDEALARIGLGTLLVYTAFSLAEDRDVVGSDGSYFSSARLSRKSFTLKVGDDQIEFLRLDPIGTLMGWGADLKEYMKEHEDDPEGPKSGSLIIDAAITATAQNILSKTYLTSLRQLVELASDASSQERSPEALGKWAASFATRFMPASGIQRSFEKGIDGVNRDAQGFMEGLVKASGAASTLPAKRDYILGRPMPIDTGERLFGLPWTPGPHDSADPLIAELERLSFDLPRQSRTLRGQGWGVKMNTKQFSRWLELRGQVVRKPSTGLTLDETLNELIQLPEYRGATRDAKINMIRDEMDGYSKLATQQLLKEDDKLASKALKAEVWANSRITGASPEARDRELQQLAQELGLQPIP